MTPPARPQPLPDSLDILLVEDNPGDARLTREAFAETDPETTLHVVGTGDEALDALSRRDSDEPFPDLVLLDLNLPGLDGCEVLAEIRSTPDVQRLPVIVVTSSSAREDVERCYDAAANAYLTKPSDPAEFVSLAESIEGFWFDHAKLPPAP